VAHEVGAFLGREKVDRGRDECDDVVEGTWARGAQERFQFREGELLYGGRNRKCAPAST